MKNRRQNFTGASASPPSEDPVRQRRPMSSDNLPGAQRGVVARGVVAQIERAIAEHPVLSVSIGLCAGVALGWLIKRR